MRRLLVLAAVLLACPAAAACSVGPPAEYQQVAATGDGAVWTNRQWSLGELWVENATFRHAVHLPVFGQWVLSPDARWAALERVGVEGGLCEVTGHELHAVDLRTNETRVLPSGESVLSMAASPRHLAVARTSVHALELYDWETGNVTRLGGFVAFDKYYGPDWQANTTTRMAFSPDGRYLAAYSATVHAVVVFDVDAGEPLRRAPPYGFPNPDPPVALAFSPDGSHLAALTSQHERFSEVFTWDLAAPTNVVVALRRYTEAGVGLLWTDAGLVVAFRDHAWPPDGAAAGILRRYPTPHLANATQTRRDESAYTGGLAATGDILYAGSDTIMHVFDVRTLAPFGAPDAPTPGTHADPPPDATPDEPGRDAPLPAAALVVAALLAGAALRRHGR